MTHRGYKRLVHVLIYEALSLLVLGIVIGVLLAEEVR